MGEYMSSSFLTSWMKGDADPAVPENKSAEAKKKWHKEKE